LLALARYLFVVATDAIKSGLVAARLVLDPALPVKPGIITIPSGCESELATALSAHAITLAPGEMVIEIGEDGAMYTHTLDATQAADYVAEAQHLRRELLRKIFL
jgi:multicomponent Na+:H+ antiporter subunit E